MRRLLLALVLAAACNGSDSTTPGASVAGTYTLQTVNGSPLPYTYLSSGPLQKAIVDDAITLTAAGTWTEQGDDRTTSNGVVTTSAVSDAGTYSVSGTTLSMASTANGAITGSLVGSTLTLNDQGLIAVYMKQ